VTGTPIGEALCEHLRKHHRGRENAASSRELEAAFALKGREIRRIVNSLRCGGCPICSNELGYFYAADRHDIALTVSQLNSRIVKISAAKNGLLSSNLYEQEKEV